MALVDQPHRVGSELRGQHPVERRRLAAALQVAEHDRPHVAVKPLGEFLGHGRVEAKRESSRAKIVVDRLRHADHRDAPLVRIPMHRIGEDMPEAPQGPGQDPDRAACTDCFELQIAVGPL